MQYISLIYNYTTFFINIVIYSLIYKYLFNCSNKTIYKNNKQILRSKPSLSILYLFLLYFIFLTLSSSTLVTLFLLSLLVGLFMTHQLDISKLYFLKIIDKNPYIIKIWNLLYFILNSFFNLLEPLHNIIVYFFKILFSQIDYKNKDNHKQLLMDELNNLINIDNLVIKNDTNSVKDQDELHNLLQEMNNVFINLEKQKKMLDSYK